jgi:hypothetical protein
VLARRVVTFHIVCLGWVFFATSSLQRAVDVLTGIATQWSLPVTSVTPLLLLTVAAVIVAQFVDVRHVDVPRLPVVRAGRDRLRRLSVPPFAQAAAFAVGLVPVLAMAPTTEPAFIYYRF